MQNDDKNDLFSRFFQEATVGIDDLFNRWRWFAIRLIVFEILFFILIGILAHYCYFNTASIFVLVSLFFAGFLVFQPKVMSLLLLMDIGNYLAGKPLTPKSNQPIPIVRAYAKTMTLALAMHTATLTRLVAVSPFVVADNQTTAALAGAGVLLFLHRVRNEGWEKAVARFILGASLVAMVAALAQTIPFVAGYVDAVCAAR